MTQIKNEEARACFCCYLSAINKLRSFCSYPPLKFEDCPDSPSHVLEWLDDQLEDRSVLPSIAPLQSLLSQVSGDPSSKAHGAGVFAVCPAAPKSTFPRRTAPLGTGVNQYRTLYKNLLAFLREIPSSLTSNWSYWLDHFDSAWASVSECLASGESSLLDKCTSLYETSKIQAVIPNSEEVLLIQGDFQGIQNFIFTEGSETNKKSSKLLRGRSFYVSLITELAALKISETLKLPPLSPVMNAAGKFLIIAPYSEANLKKLGELQKEFDDWFLTHTLGTASLITSTTKAAKDEVLGRHFDLVMKKVFEATEKAKLSTFDLSNRSSSVLPVDFASGVNLYDLRLPAESKLCADEIKVGELLVKSDVLLISDHFTGGSKSLSLPIFGYYVNFDTRKNLKDAELPDYLRVWDISIAESMEEPLFKGLARRFFSTFVAHFSYEGEENDCRYASVKKDGETLGDIKPFSHLACDNTSSSGEGLIGLACLKGDVDNLGYIFREGVLNRFGETTLAATMTLSRQVNNFFAVYLPVLFSQKYSNIYTVFAGGDDFFLIGPWHDVFELADEIRDKFDDYTLNESVHFSAGIAVVKPSVPIRTIGRMTEEALESSKSRGKNRVTAYGITVSWADWKKLQETESNLNFMKANYAISTAYLYKLLNIISLYERKDRDPFANVWRARLFYTTVRFVNDRKNEKGKDTVKTDFLPFIVNSFEKFGKAFTIPLFNSLYTTRKTGQ